MGFVSFEGHFNIFICHHVFQSILKCISSMDSGTWFNGNWTNLWLVDVVGQLKWYQCCIGPHPMHIPVDAQVKVPRELTGILKGRDGGVPHGYGFDSAKRWVWSHVKFNMSCEEADTWLCASYSDWRTESYRCLWIVWAKEVHQDASLTRFDRLEVLRIVASCCH